MPRTTAAEKPAAVAGLRLRGGLPTDNGLAPLAADLSADTTRIVYFAAAAKVKDVVRHVDTNSDTVVCAFIGVEADLLPDEMRAVQLIIDRARVRRTGEEPLFDTADAPANVTDLVAEKKTRAK